MSESVQLLLNHLALLKKVQNRKLENTNIVVSCFGLLSMISVPDIIKPLLSLAVNFHARCCICTVCIKHAWIRSLSECNTNVPTVVKQLCHLMLLFISLKWQ